MNLLAVITAIVATLAGHSSHPAAQSLGKALSPNAFCSSPGPHDYAAPLAKLPTIDKVPARSKRRGVGNLPFGPGTVEMYVDTEGPVIVRPDHFGYGFWDVGFERNEPERHPTLDWLVTAQLVALDSTGEVSEEFDHSHVNIDRINDAYQPSLNLKVPDRVGFYRYDIQISDSAGNQLGNYSEYLRVVPPSVRVRLGINGRRFRQGQTVATRPEELGTELITFGADFQVQRRSNGAWRRYPPMTPNAWAAWLGGIGPGSAGRCSSFRVPAGTPHGHYRVVKRVGTSFGREPSLSLTLTAPFSVASPG
jgi:hypothetical protein